jgi:CheY-like chemotaxis protein
MSQVMQNLVINSKHAMPNGGVLQVTASNFIVDRSVNLPLRPGPYVRISIEDDGTGIQPEHLGKIFDPYFTTKPNGTGLGLATAYSILRRHDGLITVESEWGQGSTFHLYLPASGARPAIRNTEQTPRLNGAGRILAMDDEAAIRTLLCQILRHFGYRPHAVSTGEEAILEYKRAADEGDPYRAVIMDLTVPGGMGGKEAVAELRQIDPNVRAIVSSGYSNDPVLANFRQYGFVARVDKPYRLAELAGVLSEVTQA